MQNKLFAFVMLFGLSTMTQAQTQTTTPDLPINRVVVLGDATLELPADQVRVQVNLRFTDPTDAKKAYEGHRAAEKRLVQLLKDFKIDDKDIVYSLLNVHKNVDLYGPDGRRREEVATDQQIIFKLNDLKRYPELQLTLIGGGFNNFSASFSSTKEDDNKNKVLEKAIEVARGKAETMAKASGRTLGGVLSVRDTEETDPALGRRYPVATAFATESLRAGKSAADSGNLFEFPQKIVIPAQVKVTFELK
jgi:uncharacterized protein